MTDLLADRFLPCGAAWIDLASGATVRVRLAPAGPRGDVLVWSDWCATLALMRHPLLNVLVDYGHACGGRTFEAYSVSPPLPAGPRVLTHAVAFLEQRGVHLRTASADLVLREIAAAPGRHVRRPMGIVLQPRESLRALEEALTDAAPGGVAMLTVTGARGSGLRTSYLHAARAARLLGYVPVSAALLASVPWLAAALQGRHVCVLLDGCTAKAGYAAARLASRMGMDSPRRHLVIRFNRERGSDRHSLALDPMGVTAMVSMVFKDPDYGPDEPELMAAARAADGSPGRFLAALRAPAFAEQRPTFSVVHETAPAYVVERQPQVALRRRAPARSIASAEDRAVRLAARGRHASAVRLLKRAGRVLEARGEPDLAAACAARLGWVLRERGHTRDALEAFARAGALAAEGPLHVAAAVGTGVAWTDECRFVQAEAALRSAVAAAGLIADREVECRARLALSRCLYWQARYDEAAVTLDPVLQAATAELRMRALALHARICVGQRDLPQAITSASDAIAGAANLPDRLLATVSRAMALVQAALGDFRAAQVSVEQGLASAAAAHAPLAALRLRAVARKLAARNGAGTRSGRAPAVHALGNASVPPLLRGDIEPAPIREPIPASTQDGLPQPAIQELQLLLELASNAPDDGGALNAICAHVCEKSRAATVQVLSADAERRVLARAGRPWAGDLHLIQRTFACPGAAAIAGTGEPPQAAHAIVYGGEAIAAIACRWTIGTETAMHTAASLLRSAALALAPSVRTLLDRASATACEPAWRDLLGSSAQALALRDAITRAARAPFPVLIEGESGSGKELVARAIHRLSARRERRLSAVNCAAIADDLLEAELFGHVRGAFTGAVGDRAGLFEEADGGTLFLDEVGELSPRAQAKLLRVLQDGEVRRIGENFARRVDARVVAATNRRLDDEVDAGRFRADLRFRLDVVRIRVPALRDRAVDIPQLAAHFWEEAARRVDSRASLAPETIQTLTRYEWPGNVRQLQNVIASLAVDAPRRGRVPPSLLPAHVARTAGASATTFEGARLEFERRFVSAELARAGGHRARAARALGVTRQGLAKMIRRLGIEP